MSKLKIILCIKILILLLVGCSSEKDILKQQVQDLSSKIEDLQSQKTELELTIESLNNEIMGNHSTIEKLESDLTFKDNVLRNYKNSIEELQSVKTNMMSEDRLAYIKDRLISKRDVVKYANISVGYSLEEVQNILGDDFKEGIWMNMAHGVEGRTYTYEGLKIDFVNKLVYNITLYNDKYDTSLGIKVGDDYTKSIQSIKGKFSTYSNIHTKEPVDDVFTHDDLLINIGNKSANDNDESTVSIFSLHVDLFQE